MKKDKRRFALMRLALFVISSFVILQGAAACGTNNTSSASADPIVSSETTQEAEQDEVSSQETDKANRSNQDQADEDSGNATESDESNASESSTKVSLNSIPKYKSDAYVTVNDNIPLFTQDDMTTQAFETYSTLDSLGRCRVAYANICTDIMPTEERGSIGSVKPSGWHTIKYDCIADRYLYNRCHLIAYELAGENANEQNLITGTRYMNIEGMLPFENMVADYVKETNNHVLYRVTPMYKGNNLVASGVLMEAKSVEDNGEGIEFNVFCYNVQPGVTISYKDGESQLDGTISSEDDSTGKTTVSNQEGNEYVYITDTGTKYHREGCRYLSESKHKIKKKKAIEEGYEPCGVCNP